MAPSPGQTGSELPGAHKSVGGAAGLGLSEGRGHGDLCTSLSFPDLWSCE